MGVRRRERRGMGGGEEREGEWGEMIEGDKEVRVYLKVRGWGWELRAEG